MSRKRRELIDSLAGSGQLVAPPLPALPVRYSVRVFRERIADGADWLPGLLDAEITGTAASPHDWFPYFSADSCALVLADGLRIGVFVKSALGNPVALPVRDASELAKRYPG